MGYREPFTVFRRALPSGNSVFYYQTYDEDGNRTCARSTGCRTKKAARAWCQNLYRSGKLLPEKKLTFLEYTAKWFIYDECPYIQARLARGYTFSKQHAYHQRANLVNHIIPVFGYRLLTEISTREIEKFLKSMRDSGYASRTVNYHLAVLRLIFGEAERLGDIEKNPMKSVKPFGDTGKERGVLTMEEVKRLFAPDNLEKLWGGNRFERTLNLTASLTGMRVGEIQALKLEDLQADHIHVKHSWDRIYGLKTTKTGEERKIPLPSFLQNEIMAITEGRTTGFIFSTTDGRAPIDHKAIYKWFLRALHTSGVTEAERKERNITFHSWRHYFNSRLRSKGIADAVVQKITGHKTQRMTEHYTHFELGDFKEVSEVQEEMTD